MLVNGIQIQANPKDILESLRFEANKSGKNYFRTIKPSNNHIMTNCLYHKGGMERKPSMGINIETGICNCFACQKVVNIIQLIQDTLSLNEKQAKNWLKTNFSTSSVLSNNVNKLNLFQFKEKQFVDKDELKKYRFIHKYILNRKISKDVVIRYDIGFDKETNCITFPNKDKNGNILFIARRSVKTKYFSYPAEVEKPIYGLYEILRDFNTSKLTICESMIDALTLVSLGIPAVALNGLGSMSQIDELNKLPFRTYILATDNDDKGRKSRARLKKLIKCKIIKEYDYGSFPENCKDINDMSEEQIRALKII